MNLIRIELGWGQNPMITGVVVSNIFYFHPYLGKISILANIFQMGWNHQPVSVEHTLQISSNAHASYFLSG